jgi:hypothetical protein
LGNSGNSYVSAGYYAEGKTFKVQNNGIDVTSDLMYVPQLGSIGGNNTTVYEQTRAVKYAMEHWNGKTTHSADLQDYLTQSIQTYGAHARTQLEGKTPDELAYSARMRASEIAKDDTSFGNYVLNLASDFNEKRMEQRTTQVLEQMDSTRYMDVHIGASRLHTIEADKRYAEAVRAAETNDVLHKHLISIERQDVLYDRSADGLKYLNTLISQERDDVKKYLESGEPSTVIDAKLRNIQLLSNIASTHPEARSVEITNVQ